MFSPVTIHSKKSVNTEIEAVNPGTTPKRLPGSILLLMLFLLPVPLLAQFSGDGSGTALDPYIILTVEQLNEVTNDLTAYYELGGDIDASATINWNDGLGFAPIGLGASGNDGFLGTFDGKGFIITDLYINRPSTFYVGLFREIVDGAVVRNLGIVDAEITGQTEVGGITGALEGHIENSYFVGSVTATLDWAAGGIAGAMYNASASIANCYAAGSINGANGTQLLGGITGYSDEGGTITNSYSLAEISGGDVSNQGGLVGENYATITNSYFNTETSGMGVAIGSGTQPLTASALNSLAMQSQASFIDWDFDNTWSIQEGSTFPFLQWQIIPAAYNFPVSILPPSSLEGSFDSFNGEVTLQWQVPSAGTVLGYNMYRDGELLNTSGMLSAASTTYIDTPSLTGTVYPVYQVSAIVDVNDTATETQLSNCTIVFLGFFAGEGTVESPFQITTIFHLQAMDNFRSSYFVLNNDIDASVTAQWNIENEQAKGFKPIGPSFNNSFSGSFDGNGHQITNLYIKLNSVRFVGLFGVTFGSTIQNVQLSGVDITGGENVGGIAGLGYTSTFSRLSVEGTIQSEGYGGGLFGDLFESTLTESYANVTMIGLPDDFNFRSLGGIVGRVAGSSVFSQIENVHVEGEITGGESAGGLIGVLNENTTIINSYASVLVNGGTSFPGGFIGIYGAINSTITNSYWNTSENTPGLTSFGSGDIPGVTGKSTSELQNQSTFIDWDFDTIWAIENGSFPFLINNTQFPNPGIEGELLTGLIAGPNEGWRMLSAPFPNMRYQDLLNGVWTQGFPGATIETGTPNVYWYDEATRTWNAPSDISDFVGSSSSEGAAVAGMRSVSSMDGNHDLTFDSRISGTYSLQMASSDDLIVTLTDNLLGYTHELSDGTPYSFEYVREVNNRDGELGELSRQNNNASELNRQNSDVGESANSIPSSDKALLSNWNVIANASASESSSNAITPRFTITVSPASPTSESGRSELPTKLALDQNYPNPFNPTTTIRYQLPENSVISLRVYDTLGREVAALVDTEYLSAGTHTVTFDAGRLASGVYVYRLDAGGIAITRKLTLIR